MAPKKDDFYGKEVTDAIRAACDALGVAQERLDIEVLETGSTGIFGLIRKKAHIRVSVKAEDDSAIDELFAVKAVFGTSPQGDSAAKETVEEKKQAVPEAPSPEPQPEEDPEEEPEDADSESDADDEEEDDTLDVGGEVSEESLILVRQELTTILELMGYPSAIETSCVGSTVSLTLRGEYEEVLTGPDGKTLDSLQYLLRKIVARKVTGRVRLNLNVGDYRERRLEELKARALELAEQVKADGKTQAITALNPSERRSIHMVLQEDKEIRSRSVGDGLFKKILIYKPGKGGRNGGRRKGGRSRQNKSGKQNRE